MDERERTGVFKMGAPSAQDIRQILAHVYRALTEKGYDPVDQIVGYLLSGDPTYITSHRDARTVIRQVDRLQLLEELVRCYVEHRLQPSRSG
ncbi:MAG: IreB family regulatory phosphoprotein [Armatimonadota bacterium]|nr:IreB family regulatory phosphoprotein [Armatimonadota bacterium]MDR7401371.1 IreB family regulatory phosphoprotein [Armatimonadota bacterium]MDR7404732.1 IreB family regulatory phosphoprotein [Armatimonadota bacterium]MDR7437955.1 IreB family regulatory phosphoprotein [Armatimonadota bacterium]MDR7473363.1 IreB family regulatory phosphoprotein [Armatimonadota bacterium]